MKIPRQINHLSVFLNKLFNFRQWADKRHLKLFAQMVGATIQAGSSNLNAWVPYVTGRAELAASTVRRFSRWMNNANVRVADVYAPIIKDALSEWGQETIYLAFDTTMLWNQFCRISLSVVYRGRAVPLAWLVIKHPSSMVSVSHYEDLLRQAAALLPPNVKVVLLADRGFADVKLLKLCGELNWRYRIRIKGNFVIYQGGKRIGSVSSQVPNRGDCRFFMNVSITAGHFGPVHLALARHSVNGEFWYVVSDELTSMTTFNEYGLRFSIEEQFLDEKSNGFKLAHSSIRNEKALTRLCLVLACAIVFLVAQGTQVVKENKRRWVDPHWYRGKSYFKIGWEWVKAAPLKAWRLISKCRLYGGDDPDPAMASLNQHRKRQERRPIFDVKWLIFND